MLENEKNNYVGLNLYANIRLHHHIKGLNISTAAASQQKTANRKVSTLRHLYNHGISKRLISFYYLISLLKLFIYQF